jgi:hypothetical protein
MRSEGSWVGRDLEHDSGYEEESTSLWTLYRTVQTYAEQETRLFQRIKAHFRTFAYALFALF